MIVWPSAFHMLTKDPVRQVMYLMSTVERKQVSATGITGIDTGTPTIDTGINTRLSKL